MIRLARREKLLAIGLAIFIGIWLLFTIGVKPALARIETLNRVISEKQQELGKVREKSGEYIFLRDKLDELHTKIASQPDNFELLRFLESLVIKCGLGENVSKMNNKQELSLDSNYSETIVEIQFKNLSLSQLVNFLSRLESSQVLARTKSLYIKRNPSNKDLLDATLEINNAKAI